VSGNGSVAAGYCAPSIVGDHTAVKWSAAGAATSLPNQGGAASATGINQNGNAIVGSATVDASLGGVVAALWPAVINPTAYGGLTIGDPSSADGVSADGITIVGTSDNRAVYWKTTDPSAQPIAIDPGTYTFNEAYGVSSDGNVIVGQSSMGPTIVAFRWAAGMWKALSPVSSGAQSSAHGVSDDGQVTVGNSGDQAVRWQGTTAPTLLGIQGTANAASSTGSIIVGVIGNTSSGSSSALIWDATNGARSLSDILTALGATLAGINLAEATDVSDDGSVIVGWGTTASGEAGWLVNLAGTGVSGL
jgi:uncharacterized membrane protein